PGNDTPEDDCLANTERFELLNPETRAKRWGEWRLILIAERSGLPRRRECHCRRAVIREKTGNFEIIASLEQKTGANFEANSECYRQIPCATEQGITFARTGNFEQRNRECIRAIRESV
ncbi:MAG TPA: hypothetical protein VJ349_02460, partial [Stellaceae bacterium]|nr:hypothetical protein [Stellaceae bacterium]